MVKPASLFVLVDSWQASEKCVGKQGCFGNLRSRFPHSLPQGFTLGILSLPPLYKGLVCIEDKLPLYCVGAAGAVHWELSA